MCIALLLMLGVNSRKLRNSSMNYCQSEVREKKKGKREYTIMTCNGSTLLSNKEYIVDGLPWLTLKLVFYLNVLPCKGQSAKQYGKKVKKKELR